MSDNEKALAQGNLIQDARDAAEERDLLKRDVAKHLLALENACKLLRKASSDEKVLESADAELSKAMTTDYPSGEKILEDYRKFKTARDSAATLAISAKKLTEGL